MRTTVALSLAAMTLVTAAPAGAVTGGHGVADALRANPLLVTSTVASTKHRTSTCDARDLQSRRTTKSRHRAVTNQMAPVACEQPPRSQLLTADQLKHAVAAALSVLG